MAYIFDIMKTGGYEGDTHAIRYTNFHGKQNTLLFALGYNSSTNKVRLFVLIIDENGKTPSYTATDAGRATNIPRLTPLPLDDMVSLASAGPAYLFKFKELPGYTFQIQIQTYSAIETRVIISLRNENNECVSYVEGYTQKYITIPMSLSAPIDINTKN